MASLSASLSSQNADGTWNIRWDISGLSQPINTYSGFQVSTSDGKSVTWNDGTTYDLTYNHAQGISVTGTAEAHTDKWYPAGSTTISTPGAPTPPPNAMGSISVGASAPNAPADITFAWSNPGGATSYNLSGSYSYSGYTGTSYTFYGASAGQYTLTVTPVNAYGTGGSSTTIFTLTNLQANTSAWLTGRTTYNWYIYGLSNNFNTTNYIKAAVFNTPFTNGQASQPVGLISSVNATAGYSSTTTPTISVGGAISAGGVYNMYGGVQANNGNWYTTYYNGAPQLRPPGYFQWDINKVSGNNLTVYAAEWNRLTTNINELRSIKGLGAYSFGTVFTDNLIYADGSTGYNNLRMAIYEMGGTIAGQVYAGVHDISASLIETLREGVNSIP